VCRSALLSGLRFKLVTRNVSSARISPRAPSPGVILHDDPLTVHKFCSMLPAFSMEARPVIPVMDAVRAELEVMAWRDKLTAK